MTTKRCSCCGKPFQARPQVPKQTYCATRECQRHRRQQWQREKLKTDGYGHMAIEMTGYFLFDSEFVEPLAAWQTHTIPDLSQPATQNATPIQQVRGTLSASDYLQALHNLLPYGPAWTDDPNAVISKLLDGLSQELARIDGRCWALIDEADPRSASELFSEWQSQFGLPDPCVVALGGNQSSAQRRSALVSKITNVGGASLTYYISVAKTLGYTVPAAPDRPNAFNSVCPSIAGVRMNDAAWVIRLAVEVAVPSSCAI